MKPDLQQKFNSNSPDFGKIHGAIIHNHVRQDVEPGDDPLLTGQLPTLIPGKHKDRADMATHEGTFLDSLIRIWQSIAAESREVSANWGNRKNEWRVTLGDGSDFVIRLTDAASPHTKKRFQGRQGTEQSGMIMVWYGKEKSLDFTNIESSPNIPIISADDKSESGVSFFSNQQLIQQYPLLPTAVHRAIEYALVTAVGILQDELKILDEEVGSKIDINIGIGSRLKPEVTLGRQGQSSQSGPWGHFVVVYHDDDERVADKMPLHEAAPKEMLKVMDPWVEVITSQFSESIKAIAQHAVATEKCMANTQVELLTTWDGLELVFPGSGASFTTGYCAVSAIYNALSDIQRQSVKYYKRFLKSNPNLVEAEKLVFLNQLTALGVTAGDANRYISFLESLSPTHSVVTELLQGRMVESKRKRLLKIQKKMSRYNSPAARHNQNVLSKLRRDRLAELHQKYLENEAVAIQSKHLQRRIVTTRARLLASHLRGQLLVSPTLHPNGIETMLPQSRLTAVAVAKDFTYKEEGMKIQKMYFSLSFAGRGGFEVITKRSQIVRERPA